MSMIPFRGAARREPNLNPPPRSAVSPETAAFLDRTVEIEQERDELLQTVAQLKGQLNDNDNRHRATIAQLDTQISVLRGQLDIAEAKRDNASRRAVAAQTALRIASKIIVDAHEEGEAAAAAMEQPNPPHGNEAAQDLDEQLTEKIGKTFGADNRTET